MTDPLDAKAARQLRSLGTWIRKADALIGGKLADAEAHLIVAVSDTLKRKPDGRPTLRHAARSPSVKAALARLDELLEALAGPSISSLAGLARDAREAFYRESFAEWRRVVPEALWTSADPKPTRSNIAKARGIVIHGQEIRREIGGPVARASLSVSPAVSRAGRRASSPKDSAAILRDWRVKSTDAISLTVRLALSDSQVALDVVAGRDLIHPDHLDDTPIAVGA